MACTDVVVERQYRCSVSCSDYELIGSTNYQVAGGVDIT